MLHTHITVWIGLERALEVGSSRICARGAPELFWG